MAIILSFCLFYLPGCAAAGKSAKRSENSRTFDLGDRLRENPNTEKKSERNRTKPRPGPIEVLVDPPTSLQATPPTSFSLSLATTKPNEGSKSIFLPPQISTICPPKRKNLLFAEKLNFESEHAQ
jgi:hypothetical protein